MFSNERGSVSIAFVMFTIITLSLLCLSAIDLTVTDSRMSVNHVQRTQALFVAEAGIEYGIALLFQGQNPPYTETVQMDDGEFSISIVLNNVVTLISTGNSDNAKQSIQVTMDPMIGSIAIYSTGDINNVITYDENGDPDPSLNVENAGFPNMSDSTLIAMATSQGQVETGAVFVPSHGYPNFNFYYSAGVSNVTYVTGDLRVQGGRTIYGIFVVEGNIILNGSSRVEGVLYMKGNGSITHGGGNPSESSITGGIIANGDIDGTGNGISVTYNPEYMLEMGKFENKDDKILSWRQLFSVLKLQNLLVWLA